MSAASSLSEMLALQVRRSADSCAFITNGRRISYGELGLQVDAAAAWLTGQGIRPGDRVAVWMVNRVEWLALLFGASRIGATVVAVNTRYRSAELQHILSGSGARLLVLQERFRKINFLGLLAEVDPSAVPQLDAIAVVDGVECPPEMLGKPVTALTWPDSGTTGQRGACAPDQLAVLFATSGTTRMPKLVMHSQRTLALHSQSIATAYGFDEAGTVVLGALPLCGVFGLNPVLAALAVGAAVVVMEAFDGPEAACLIEQHCVSHLFGSDELFRRLLDSDLPQRDFGSLRCCGFASFSAGAEQLVKDAGERGVPLVGLYGSSEVQALFALQSRDKCSDGIELGGGYPASGEARVRIRDLETGELLGPGCSGMIEIAAPTNFSGYLNAPEATADAVDSEGYFRTGDVGYLRPDGSFVYLTRQGDAIRLAGFLVNPAEIEDVIRQCPGVAGAQVIGVDIEGEQACVAFVVPTQPTAISEAEVLSCLENEIARFKLPRRVWFINRFPVTESANGAKIQRAQLRQMATDRLATS